MNYEDRSYRSVRIDDDGNTEIMANFVAEITRETRFIDGISSRAVLTIEGMKPSSDDADQEPQRLPPIEVPAEDFPNMGWVLNHWGVQCVIRPGGGIKDDLRTFIQLRSKPELKTVYKQTGWAEIDGRRVYLHVGGGIGARGNDPSITVRLPQELQNYDLRTSVPPREGVRAALAMLDLARPELVWPLLAGTLAPLYGPVDFAIHITGRTGSFKSELVSLFQSFYGGRMDARHLPGSWSSTPNAIEALAFFAANAVFVLDDFVPHGTSWQQRALQANADKIIRAQGNQSGRARLTDLSNLQTTMYPRGLILSTGEDTPEGHSVRARMLILEVAAGEIESPELTEAQRMRPLLSAAVTWTIQQLAGDWPDLTPRVEQLRAEYRAVGHSRTPGMLGRLVATAEHWLHLVHAAGFISAGELAAHLKASKPSIESAGARQMSYLEDADPVDVFSAAVRQVLASGGGHFRTVNGGIPVKAALLGWTEERSIGQMASFKARGPVLGWARPNSDELLLDITTGYAIVSKAAGKDLALSKLTLFKRLKDGGLLLRVDEGRQRNTVRLVAEGHPRNVLAMSLSKVLQLNEVIDDDGSDDDDDGAGHGDAWEGDDPDE